MVVDVLNYDNYDILVVGLGFVERGLSSWGWVCFEDCCGFRVKVVGSLLGKVLF